MGTKAVVRWEGEAKGLDRVIENLTKKVNKLQQGLKQVKSEGKKTGNESASSFKLFSKGTLDVARGIGLATTATQAWQTALKLVVAEFDNIRERQIRAAETKLTIAGARAEAIGNLPRGVPVTVLEKLVEDAATRKGFELERAKGFQLGGAILSATSGLSGEQRAAVFAEAAKEAALTNQPQRAFAGAIGDVMKNIPAISKGRTPEQAALTAAGVIEEFAKAARPEDRKAQADTLRDLNAIALGAGLDPERTFEIGAVISQLGGDVEGKKSATALGRLAKNLGIARTKGFDIGGGKRLRIKGRGSEAIAELQDEIAKLSPLERDTLFTGFALGKSSIGFAVRAFLERTPEAVARDVAASREIGPIGEAGASRRLRIQQAQSGTFGQLAADERAIRVGKETLRLADPKRARAGLFRKEAAELLSDAGKSALAAKILGLKFAFGVDPADALAEALRGARETFLPQPERTITVAGPGAVFTEVVPATEGDPASAAAMMRIIDRLEERLDSTPSPSDNAHVESE